jgi:NADH-quinone oxidoreductase subunit N
VAGLLVILVVGFGPLASRWAPMLGVLAALTMTVANLVALRQREAIGLLAWSSIAQAGWVVAPLAAAGWDNEAARRASLVYLASYAAMTLATFTAVALVGRARATVGGGLALADFRGLARTEPLTAGLLVFALACLAGLPPGLVGLFAKLAAFSPVVGAGTMWLAVIMALNVALALAYYLRWAAAVFARPEGGVQPVSFRLSIPDGVAIGLTLTATVALSAAPTLVFRMVG